MDPAVAANLLNRLHDKLENNRKDIVKYENVMTDDAEVLVLAYGCVARSARGAVNSARKEGIKTGLFRPITLWPSPHLEILKAAQKAHTVIVPEMNIGQYAAEVSRILHDGGGGSRVVKLPVLGGALIHPNQILNKIKEVA